MKKKVFTQEEIDYLIEDYQKGTGYEALSYKYRTSKIRVKEIIQNAGIHLRSLAETKNYRCLKKYVVEDTKIPKYLPVEGKHYVCRCRLDDYTCEDYLNKGGFLTTHLSKVCGIEVPSLWKRNEYYKETGNYWYELYFDITLEDNNPTIKCPYCDWTSDDIDNRSGMFGAHLLKKHDISKQQFVAEHPEWREYFRMANPSLDRQFEEDETKFVTCEICGKKFARIDNVHLAKHGITVEEYKKIYNTPLISQYLHNRLSEITIEANANMAYNYASKGETEVLNYIQSLGLEAEKNRKILHGKELDIYIPEKQIAIEYNGCMWHTEFFGKKDRLYHYNKTKLCADSGVTLIHIFEDEWELHKDIVKEKLANALHKENFENVYYARRCEIIDVSFKDAKEFLNTNHIQGATNGTIHIGAAYNGKLVAVMSFLEENAGNWNLVRFATELHSRCPGVASKIFKHFIKKHNPESVKSFLDRRWCFSEENNLYTKLGFKFDNYVEPNYRYYNPEINKFERFHKFAFRKQILNKKYGFPMDMEELEMARSLGYDRIWDCGLIRYVWKREA